jgi:Tfp pilus assembly protein PilO
VRAETGLLLSLGHVGLAGVGLCLFCLSFYFGTVKPLGDELAELRSSVAALERQALPVAGSLAPEKKPEPNFPAPDELPRLIERLQILAERRGIMLDRPVYQVTQDAGSGVVDYEISVSAKGGYPDIRTFVADLALPQEGAVMTGLSLRRGNAADPLVEAHLRLVARFRMRL